MLSTLCILSHLSLTIGKTVKCVLDYFKQSAHLSQSTYHTLCCDGLFENLSSTTNPPLKSLWTLPFTSISSLLKIEKEYKINTKQLAHVFLKQNFGQ